jgi:hypothetical protein
MNLSILDRFGSLAIAASILFVAYRMHGAGGKHVKRTKPAALILAFLAGCAFLVTFVGSWILNVKGLGEISVAGLITCAGIIFVDWLLDKKPDKPAFWAAFALAFFLILGGASLSTATDQVKRGGTQVEQVVNKMGK